MIVSGRVFEVQVVVSDKSGQRKLVNQNGMASPVTYRDGRNTPDSKPHQFHKDMLVPTTQTNTYHIPARTHDQALEKAKKYGRPVSVRKLEQDRIFTDIEKLFSKESYAADNPYLNPIAMDEMIWNKRNSRRLNSVRDRPDY